MQRGTFAQIMMSLSVELNAIFDKQPISRAQFEDVIRRMHYLIHTRHGNTSHNFLFVILYSISLLTLLAYITYLIFRL